MFKLVGVADKLLAHLHNREVNARFRKKPRVTENLNEAKMFKDTGSSWNG